MIAPLTAFSAVYTARARPPVALPPVSAPSSGVVAGAAGSGMTDRAEKTPAPPLTGAVNRLSRASMLLAAQESGKAVKSPIDHLSGEERKVVTKLRKRDQEVRRHERAHMAAAGPYGGMPVYDLQKGPDGRLYAVGGEVSIDVKPLKDPAATIAKEEIVIRAALAPANPSAQDHSVAAQARQLKAEAISKLNREKEAEAEKAANKDHLSNRFPQAAKAASAADAYGKVGAGTPVAAVIDILTARQGVSLSV